MSQKEDDDIAFWGVRINGAHHLKQESLAGFKAGAKFLGTAETAIIHLKALLMWRPAPISKIFKIC